MSLFFYRSWAGEDGGGAVSTLLLPDNGLYYTRWGYCALLAVTLLAGLALNITYLAGYSVCPRAGLAVPHIAMVSLALRDLLVCLLVLPAAIYWLSFGMTSWPGGELWCKLAVFSDYFLSTLHPLLIVVLCLILYTRKVAEVEPPPAPQLSQSRMSGRSGRAASSRPGPASSLASPALRPPSVAGSVQSSQSIGRHDGFRRGFAKKPGTTGSTYAGSVSGSMSGSVSGRNMHSAPRASSPLHTMEEERYAESVDGELWELASMEYPGRNDLDLDLTEEEEEEEPRLREWLRWLVPLSWAAALGVGVPAAMLAQYTDKKPQCYLAADKELLTLSRGRLMLQDPTLNLLISSVVINYIISAAAIFLLAILLCTTRWTKDGKLNRFYKMAIAVGVLFVGSRSPVDIIQFKNLIYTASQWAVTNPDQIGECGIIIQFQLGLGFWLNTH